jgi:DNA-binding response OmpR family regulator
VTEPGRIAAKFDRILVVDANMATAKMLANLLRSLWRTAEVYGAKTADAALELAAAVQPDLVFVEAAGPGLDGMAFARAYRRSDEDWREAPVIMIFGEITGPQIVEARNCGVNEFLRRPYAMGDLQKRLELVSARQRDWIEASAYVGPDRRRGTPPDYRGPRRRRSDR